MGKLALMFPGQGSQTVGMGCDLCAVDVLMRDTYDEASAVLGFDLSGLCAHGAPQELARTDVTQPALLAHSVGVLRLLVRDGLRFDGAFGHSLGEYSALVATGALRFEDGVRLVQRRGREMLRAAESNPGGMAAVLGLDDESVERLCDGIDGLWPANHNSPGQVVVSGTPAALVTLEERAGAAGARKVVRLNVSGAFHSPLVQAALAPLRTELEATAWRAPDPPFYSVCSLRFERDGFSDLLQRQLVSPVRFTQAVKALYAEGYDSYLEVGPGSVLGGLVRRIEPRVRVARAGDVESVAAAHAWANAEEGT